MRIAEATSGQLPQVMEVERLAFGGDVEAALVRDLIADPTAAPVLSLLAWDGEQTVGHILFTAVRVVGARRDVTASILAPLAVIPEAQNQGVGGRLIEAGVQLLEQAGVELVFVLGHPGYYPRHGFEPSTPYGLEAPYPISPAEAWMVRALTPGLLGAVKGTVACADVLDRPELWRE